MTPRFLLDTNVWSDLVSAAPPAKLVKVFGRHEQEVALSATVWHELLFGAIVLNPDRQRLPAPGMQPGHSIVAHAG